MEQISLPLATCESSHYCTFKQNLKLLVWIFTFCYWGGGGVNGISLHLYSAFLCIPLRLGIFIYIYKPFTFTFLKCLFKFLPIFLRGSVFHRHCFISPGPSSFWVICRTYLLFCAICFLFVFYFYFLCVFGDWKQLSQHLFSILVFMLLLFFSFSS